MRRDMEEARAK